MKTFNICSISDLEVVVKFVNDEGNEIPVPRYDFELEYFVYANIVRRASAKKGVFTNCAIMEDNRLHCFFDKPELGRGQLHRRHLLHIPCDEFTDDVRTTIREGTLPVQFVNNPTLYSDKPIIEDVVVAPMLDFDYGLISEAGDDIITEDGCLIIF